MYCYRNSATARRLVQSPTLQSTIFCGVHSDLRGKGIRVSPAWLNLMLNQNPCINLLPKSVFSLSQEMNLHSNAATVKSHWCHCQFEIVQTVYWLQEVQVWDKYLWPNPTKPGTSRKTCFWVNSHKRWLVQNYFQICIFMLIKWGTMYPFKCLKESNQTRFFSNNKWWIMLIPIHSCSKWKTKWPISKKCSEAKICRCHLQNQPYLEKCLCYKHDLGIILKLSLKWFTWY